MKELNLLKGALCVARLHIQCGVVYVRYCRVRSGMCNDLIWLCICENHYIHVHYLQKNKLF